MKTSADTYSRQPGRPGWPRWIVLRLVVLGLAGLVLASCAARRGNYGPVVASWYGPGFDGKLTASGERYNMYAMTCAHKTLPFGTRLKLTNTQNGRSTIVTVNDRGPFVPGRDIDLSKSAAQRLDLIGDGTGRVMVQVLGRDMRYSKYLKGGVVPAKGGTQPYGYYTVQVAAFSEKTNADHIFLGLKLNHDKVYIVEALVNGQKFYRVRVGKFGSHDKATGYARKLAEEGYAVHIAPFEM